MEQQNFGHKILEKIRQGRVKPKAKWIFVAKNAALWLVGMLCLALGSLSVSVIIYVFSSHDWVLLRQIGIGRYAIIALPYLWVILLVFFILLLHFDLRHTKKGYKIRMAILVGSILVASIIIGAVFYAFGLANLVDYHFSRKVPFFKQFAEHRISAWTEPEKGLLAGVLTGRLEENKYNLKDMSGKEWSVNIEKIPDGRSLIIGCPYKIKGSLLNENAFKAEMIFPMGAGRGLIHEQYLKGRLPKPRSPVNMNFLKEEFFLKCR